MNSSPSAVQRRDESLVDQLNRQVLQTLRELKTRFDSDPDPEDPGIEDEYEFEVFGNTGPRKNPHK